MLDRQLQQMKEGFYFGARRRREARRPRRSSVSWPFSANSISRARSTPTSIPRVQALEEELKSARADAAALRSQPESARQETLIADPAYQQVVADRNLTQLRVRALQRTEAQLSADIGAVSAARRSGADGGTGGRITRRASTSSRRRTSGRCRERHAAALVQEQIARTRGGERFSVLNHAYVPQSPESPNRQRLLLMAVALGLALGAAPARSAASSSTDRFATPGQLQDEFEVPVLAEIPRIHDAA